MSPVKRGKKIKPDRTLPPFAAALLLLICGGLVGAVMFLGNTDLWMTEKQIDQLEGNDTEFRTSDGKIVLGSYCAVSNLNDTDRNINLKTAASKIDGLVINPGESFSFNTVVGNTSDDPAYKEAAVIKDDVVSKERGGGVCQVSTAIYVAAMRAGLEVTQRSAHTQAIDYAPLGLDATIYYGKVDLVFRNNTQSDIIIYVSADGPSVTANIVGKSQDETLKHDLISEITETYKTGAGDNQSEYFVVASYLISYRNGEILSKDVVKVDLYLSMGSEYVTAGLPDDLTSNNSEKKQEGDQNDTTEEKTDEKSEQQ